MPPAGWGASQRSADAPVRVPFLPQLVPVRIGVVKATAGNCAIRTLTVRRRGALTHLTELMGHQWPRCRFDGARYAGRALSCLTRKRPAAPQSPIAQPVCRSYPEAAAFRVIHQARYECFSAAAVETSVGGRSNRD